MRPTVLKSMFIGVMFGTCAAALSSLALGILVALDWEFLSCKAGSVCRTEAIFAGAAESSLALAFSGPPALFAGTALGFLARQIHREPWTRRFALLCAGPIAVFGTQLLIHRLLGISTVAQLWWSGSPSAPATTICALPGLIAGAFLLEKLLRPNQDEMRARELARRLEQLARLERQAGTPGAAMAERALGDESASVREVALRWIADCHEDAFKILREFLARAAESDLHAIAAGLLGPSNTGWSLLRRTALSGQGAPDRGEFEDTLLAILERGAFATQRDATIALGDVGGPRALDALAANLAVGYLTEESALAMRRIRARLLNAGPGKLSVAETPEFAGALSIPAAGIGKLSL